jgi:hypothetical protein
MRVTAPNAVGRAMYEEFSIELTEAQQRTPVDTGALRRSAFITQPEQEADGAITMRMGFGGPAAPYAVFVHEDLNALHPIGQAKFLESTLNESAPYMAGRIARRVSPSELVR